MLSTGLPQGAVPKLERPGPLRERVYEALLELITTRALQPGQHLVESELAGHLGVSRQPVREALQRLNTEGWVDLRPAQGAFVHEPTEEEADQLLTVRTLLEAEAARLAAANAGTRGHRRARGAVRQRVSRPSPTTTWTARSRRTPASTRRSWNSRATSSSPSWPHRWTAGSAGTTRRSPGSAASSPGSSTATLIAAIADRDEQRATEVMRAHTEHTRETYHARPRETRALT